MHFSFTFCAFSHSLSESSSMMRLFAAATDRRPSMVLCTDGHTCARSCTRRDSEIRIYLCMRLHPFMQALTIMGQSISLPAACIYAGSHDHGPKHQSPRCIHLCRPSRSWAKASAPPKKNALHIMKTSKITRKFFIHARVHHQPGARASRRQV
jgi:hypothetical protein